MDKHIEELINNAMLSSLEGYAFLVADSIEFELGRKLTTTEHRQVFVAVEHVASGNSALLAKLEAAEFEIKELNRRLETPVSLPKAAYFHNSAENLPFFRAFSVIEAIHAVGFKTVTYED
ncbi:Uncharacterised protein [Yersinia rohdei]|uniref:hypothetical protein n=1 Tax=Yersinia rohdei TaxID=29485 RepID=UPI00061C6AC9|nr:hypothetical protein [Yersinia rohdei]CNF17382.1 Uncharacterised protein [Yersinia rohdei]